MGPSPDQSRQWNQPDFIPQTPVRQQNNSHQSGKRQQSSVQPSIGGQAYDHHSSAVTQHRTSMPVAQFNGDQHQHELSGYKSDYTYQPQMAPSGMSQTFPDPFVDPSSVIRASHGMTPPNTRNETTMSAPHGMTSSDARNEVASSASTSMTGSPEKTDNYPNEAARLAALIKSGKYDEPAVNRGSRRGSYIPPNRHRGEEWILQQPMQQTMQQPMPMPVMPVVRQTFEPVQCIPDPPFLEAAVHGYRPTAEETFDYVPFTEHFKSPLVADAGIVKIRNVSLEHLVTYLHLYRHRLTWFADSLRYNQE